MADLREHNAALHAALRLWPEQANPRRYRRSAVFFRRSHTVYEDLDCWKLAMELADLFDAMTSEGEAAKDFAFRSQLRRSGTKAPAQIAEGFLRFRPADFANFLRMARASLGEAQTHLERGRRRSYGSEETVARARKLSDRALGATTRLMNDRLAAAAAEQQQPTTRRQSGHRGTKSQDPEP
jgi:four helix bundle protein